MTLAAGTRLGPYEIQSAIGAGSMGEVYSVEQECLEGEEGSAATAETKVPRRR